MATTVFSKASTHVPLSWFFLASSAAGFHLRSPAAHWYHFASPPPITRSSSSSPMPRRSLRLQGLSPKKTNQPNEEGSSSSLYLYNEGITSKKPQQSDATSAITGGRKRKLSTNAKSSKRNSKSTSNNDHESLPRIREIELLLCDKSNTRYVLGVDEAGRGPLAGPVVAAAVWIPHDNVSSKDTNDNSNNLYDNTIAGIVDSKRITKEEQRQELFNALTAATTSQDEGKEDKNNMLWAAAVMDASYIDKVNILQATLHGMTLASQAVIWMHNEQQQEPGQALTTNPGMQNTATIRPPPPMNHIETEITYHDQASSEHSGCYVVTSKPFTEERHPENANSDAISNYEDYYALIDGNRLPKAGMPCPAEAMTKGDGREYCIAAASIVAKVVRDNLMREYHELYPEYNLEQHKGYPTAAHMDIVTRIGASPIHRRSFKPLKDLKFDENGKVLGPRKKEDSAGKKKKK